MIQEILNALGTEDFEIFLSCPGELNYRREIDSKYKANRTKDPPPHLQDLREYLVLTYGAKVQEDQEADDALGIAQDETTCICSIDKDLLMIPGEHYNFVKRERFGQTELEGLRHFYSQLLIGDPTDNIKGVAGIGRVKAERGLSSFGSEAEFFDFVRWKYCDDHRLLRNGRLLWIRRRENEIWSYPLTQDLDPPFGFINETNEESLEPTLTRIKAGFPSGGVKTGDLSKELSEE